MTKEATLVVGDQEIKLPLVEGSMGEKAVDIRKLRATTGLITLDNGYMNTGSCESKITFIKGDEGILLYRGHNIEKLCEEKTFEEVIGLLIYGDFFEGAELENFNAEVTKHAYIPKELLDFVNALPKNTHPMAQIAAYMNALTSVYPKWDQSPISSSIEKEAYCAIMGHMAYFIGSIIAKRQGRDFYALNLKTPLTISQIFLKAAFGDSEVHQKKSVIDTVDILLTLHGDHEQNCSASTVRVVGSSLSPLLTSLAAGVNALYGPSHGGANEAVIKMLNEMISESSSTPQDWIDKAKDKNDPFKLMGFGHRVYKNFDPRAKVIKSHCDTVLDELNLDAPVLELAKNIEKKALSDSYFVDRKLFPNVDFYSGIIYSALDIPTDVFTGLFVLGRLPGWIAQYREMVRDPSMKINRPRQIYQGPKRI